MALMQAKRSIKILAWEMTFSFGLVQTQSGILFLFTTLSSSLILPTLVLNGEAGLAQLPSVCDPATKWVSLEVRRGKIEFV